MSIKQTPIKLKFNLTKPLTSAPAITDSIKPESIIDEKTQKAAIKIKFNLPKKEKEFSIEGKSETNAMEVDEPVQNVKQEMVPNAPKMNTGIKLKFKLQK